MPVSHLRWLAHKCASEHDVIHGIDECPAHERGSLVTGRSYRLLGEMTASIDDVRSPTTDRSELGRAWVREARDQVVELVDDEMGMASPGASNRHSFGKVNIADLRTRESRSQCPFESSLGDGEEGQGSALDPPRS